MVLEASLLHDKVGAAGSSRTVLSFQSVSKRFGAVLANDSISFDVDSGGIHAIVGENGAGKSTLTKILNGYYRADAGSILLDGREIVLDAPADARRLGIGMVHQQLALVPSLSGFENVVLGDPNLPFAFRKRDVEKRVTSKARALGFEIDLSCPVSQLGIAERQKLEIFKLLWRDARILILDEPTSQLTPFEAHDVLTIAKGLADAGRIVILITHHIGEVMRFAERITVLHKGQCISTVDGAAASSDDLARQMVDSHDSLPATAVASHRERGASLIGLRAVSTKVTEGNRALDSIDLDVCAGEIVGVAGISGSGQAELGRLIAGLLEPASGRLEWSGQNAGISQGESMCYIPSEQRQACAPALSVSANCFLKSVNSAWSHTMGFLKGSLIDTQARKIIDAFDIRPSQSQVPASALSGGNLQRLIIGRELSTQAKVVVADNPCAGLDAAMAARVRQEFRRAADDGRGILLISPDLEELITTCDRILVMFNGRLNGEKSAGDFDYQALALRMGGKA